MQTECRDYCESFKRFSDQKPVFQSTEQRSHHRQWTLTALCMNKQAFPAPVSVHLTLNTSLGAKLYGSSLANKRHFLLRTLLICVRVCAHKCALYRCDFLMWSSRWKCFSMANSCHVSVFQTNEKFIEEKSPQMRLQFIEYCLAP